MKRLIAIIALLCVLAVPLFAKPGKSASSSSQSAKNAATGESADLPPYQAPPSRFGLGIFLGQPTGLSFGLDLGPTTWLDFKAAWDFAGGTTTDFALLFQGDYELAFPGVFVIKRNDIVPYFGLGAELAVNSNDVGLGLRIPFGLDYRFVNIPLELKLELGLGMNLFPSTKFNGSGGLAVRYRFK